MNLDYQIFSVKCTNIMGEDGVYAVLLMFKSRKMNRRVKRIVLKIENGELRKYTVIIWGIGDTYNRLYNAIKFEEMKGNIDIKGLISLETYVSFKDGYKVLCREEILEQGWDYIIVMAVGENYNEIERYILTHNIQQERIISGEVFAIPNFDFSEYVKIKRRNISIIADCCWGGVIYERMKLPFLSPFVGTYILSKDYIKMLENLEYYLNQSLVLDMEMSMYKNFPVAKLADISVRFPHARSFQEAEIKWNARKKRVNRNDLLVEMRIGSDVEMAERFEALPYNKKIGWSSIRMGGLDSIVYLPEYNIEYRRGAASLQYEIYEEGEFWEYILSNKMMDNIDLFSLLEGDMLNVRRRNIEEK